MIFEALTLSVLSGLLGALLHRIYIENFGKKFSIPGWKFNIWKGNLLQDKLFIVGDKENGKQLRIVIDKEAIDVDYGIPN